jgi:type III pantothenate kinase
MILCLDVGNSHIFGGIFVEEELKFRFRYATNLVGTSDQLGIFFRQVLRENHIDYTQIQHLVLCSVVPALDYSITAACLKYLDKDPFIIKAGIKTGLKLHIKNPLELGADRMATSIAAAHMFPKQNIIIADYGTATTYCAISADNTYLGGVILPGLRTAMQSLHNATAKLPPVEILKPDETLSKTTEGNIQAGLYYGQLGAAQLIIKNLIKEAFSGEKPVIIGTGGFAYLFENEHLFDIIVPDLVLHGLRVALTKNLK